MLSRLIKRFIFKTPVRNPYTPDTLRGRYYEAYCRVNGCITVGEYYGMAQSTCKRCGGRNWCAGHHVPKWRMPDWVYEQRKQRNGT